MRVGGGTDGGPSAQERSDLGRSDGASARMNAGGLNAQAIKAGLAALSSSAPRPTTSPQEPGKGRMLDIHV